MEDETGIRFTTASHFSIFGRAQDDPNFEGGKFCDPIQFLEREKFHDLGHEKATWDIKTLFMTYGLILKHYSHYSHYSFSWVDIFFTKNWVNVIQTSFLGLLPGVPQWNRRGFKGRCGWSRCAAPEAALVTKMPRQWNDSGGGFSRGIYNDNNSNRNDHNQ